jgi:hypothetical protein
VPDDTDKPAKGSLADEVGGVADLLADLATGRKTPRSVWNDLFDAAFGIEKKPEPTSPTKPSNEPEAKPALKLVSDADERKSAP